MEGILSLLIPIVAIVGAFAANMLKRWTQHEQEMARIHATTQFHQGAGSTTEIENLRQELARLRDTTTQYDMSVEHALQEVQQRLATLESKTTAMPRTPVAPQQAQPEEQTITLGQGR